VRTWELTSEKPDFRVQIRLAQGDSIRKLDETTYEVESGSHFVKVHARSDALSGLGLVERQGKPELIGILPIGSMPMRHPPMLSHARFEAEYTW
jgi:hypothetical protein